MANNLDLILYAMVAGFVILLLIRQLGRRVDGEPTADDFIKNMTMARTQEAPESATKADSIDVTPIEPSTPDFSQFGAFGEKLQEIRAIDGNFDPNKFIKGAERAFEFILSAYVKGDSETIRKFVSAELAQFLIDIIDKRNRNGLSMEPNYLIAINAARMVDVELHNQRAVIAIEFESEQIYAIYDKNKQLVEGDGQKIVEKIDRWYFERQLTTNDPTWYLVEIRTENS